MCSSADDNHVVDADDDNDGDKAKPKGKAAKLVLDMKKNGHPILPVKDSENPLNLHQQKDLIRVFMTSHYSEPSLQNTLLCDLLKCDMIRAGWSKPQSIGPLENHL